MKIKAFLGATCALSLILSSSVFANALQDGRAWQFEGPVAKQYKLNAELARIKLKNGGFTQVFNISADGASTVYVGNNTTIGSIENQINQTNVANQSNVSYNIDGDGNTISGNTSNINQNNIGSSQSGTVGYAIGAKNGDNSGPVELVVGLPIIP